MQDGYDSGSTDKYIPTTWLFLYKLLFIFWGSQQAHRHFNVHLTYIHNDRIYMFFRRHILDVAKSENDYLFPNKTIQSS